MISDRVMLVPRVQHLQDLALYDFLHNNRNVHFHPKLAVLKYDVRLLRVYSTAVRFAFDVRGRIYFW